MDLDKAQVKAISVISNKKRLRYQSVCGIQSTFDISESNYGVVCAHELGYFDIIQKFQSKALKIRTVQMKKNSSLYL